MWQVTTVNNSILYTKQYFLAWVSFLGWAQKRPSGWTVGVGNASCTHIKFVYVDLYAVPYMGLS